MLLSSIKGCLKGTVTGKIATFQCYLVLLKVKTYTHGRGKSLISMLLSSIKGLPEE